MKVDKFCNMLDSNPSATTYPHIRSPWYTRRLYLVIRQRDWPWYRQIHNGSAMMLMMLLLMWRVIIRADDPWMESLWMLRGQTPQKRLLMLLLPHAVHFEMHLAINKYTSSKGGKKKKKNKFSHPSARTKYVRPSSLAIVSRKFFNSLFLSVNIISQFLCHKDNNVIVIVTCLYPRFIQQSLVSIGKHNSKQVSLQASLAILENGEYRSVTRRQ